MFIDTYGPTIHSSRGAKRYRGPISLLRSSGWFVIGVAINSLLLRSSCAFGRRLKATLRLCGEVPSGIHRKDAERRRGYAEK